MAKTKTIKYCDKHEKEYIGRECSICWVDRIAEEHRQRKEEEKRLKEEARKKRLEEAAKQYAKEPVRPPCQLGQRCEWAVHNGKNITCMRMIAGCVKKRFNSEL